MCAAVRPSLLSRICTKVWNIWSHGFKEHLRIENLTNNSSDHNLQWWRKQHLLSEIHQSNMGFVYFNFFVLEGYYKFCNFVKHETLANKVTNWWFIGHFWYNLFMVKWVFLLNSLFIHMLCIWLIFLTKATYSAFKLYILSVCATQFQIHGLHSSCACQ